MKSSSLALIDSSAWIEALRKGGDEEIRRRVESLMVAGRAAWCDLVRLELWNGARGSYERGQLKTLESVIENLPMDAEVWEVACQMARSCRDSGVTVPATDLAIAACAKKHQSALEHSDRHFDQIGQILGL